VRMSDRERSNLPSTTVRLFENVKSRRNINRERRVRRFVKYEKSGEHAAFFVAVVLMVCRNYLVSQELADASKVTFKISSF